MAQKQRAISEPNEKLVALQLKLKLVRDCLLVASKHSVALLGRWVTYIFLGGSIVELIGLHASVTRLLELHLEEGLISQLLVHQVLLLVAVHGGGSLGQLLVLVGQELFLVSQAVSNIRIVHALVLDDAAEEVFVVCLRRAAIVLAAEGRVLLEHLFVRFNISDNLAGLEN